MLQTQFIASFEWNLLINLVCAVIIVDSFWGQKVWDLTHFFFFTLFKVLSCLKHIDLLCHFVIFYVIHWEFLPKATGKLTFSSFSLLIISLQIQIYSLPFFHHISSLPISGPLSSLCLPCCCVNKVKVKGCDSSAPSRRMQGHLFFFLCQHCGNNYSYHKHTTAQMAQPDWIDSSVQK